MLFAACAAAAWLLTGAVRRYALARSILDIPNHRSSHAAPVPRGGGLAITAVILAGAALGGALGIVPARAAVALAGGGAIVAGVGWLDDHSHVSARYRAMAHFAAAAFALFCLGGMDSLRLGSGEVFLGPAGPALALLGIVWATNLYNFMDGIDGIAGGEAVVVGTVGGVLLWLSGHGGLALLAVLVAGAGFGFLVWNWAPARIFMGDVGSGLLGFAFAVLAVASENAGGVPLLGWVLLLGAFFWDATATLLRRVAHGERWYDAHRSHAYQRAVQSGLSHRQVTGSVLLLTALLAVLAATGWRWPDLLLPALAAGVLLVGAAYAVVERRRPMFPQPPAPLAGSTPSRS
jgi:Fuc2NAc and GlcNAc transferase